MNRYSLANTAQKNLLSLIKFLIPKKNNIPSTVKRLYEYLNINIDLCTDKFYCNKCQTVLDDMKTCLNRNCSMYRSKSKNQYDIFTSVSIEEQVKIIIKQNINILINTQLSNKYCKDLVDGKFYECIKKENVLSLMVYTDAIDIASSSINQCWPVFASLIELPFYERQKKKNFIFCGIWWGQRKPNSMILLSALHEQITAISCPLQLFCNQNYLSTINFQFYGIIADTVAKTTLLNMVGHTGYFGCHYCYVKGYFIKYI